MTASTLPSTPRKTKSEVVEVEGLISKIELRKFPSRSHSYDSNRESYDVKAMVAVTTPEGKALWFYSPPATYSITQGGPCFVSTVRENAWIKKSDIKWSTTGALGSSGFGDTPALIMSLGDTIRISGRVKNPNTRFGLRLSHVHLVSHIPSVPPSSEAILS